jgi:hypothetical protein
MLYIGNYAITDHCVLRPVRGILLLYSILTNSIGNSCVKDFSELFKHL